MRRSVAVVLLVAVLLLALGGPAASQTPLELWLMPFVDAPERALAPLIRQFEADTGTKVNISVVAYGVALERLQTAIAGGRAPDVTYLTDGRYVPLIEFGSALQPIDGYITPDFRRRFVDPGLLDGYKWEGRSYVVPFGFVTYLWAINRAVLEKAGVYGALSPRLRDLSKAWTWDDLLQICRAITRDTDGDTRVDQWCYAYPGGSTWLHPFLLWLWAAGGNLFTAEGRPGLDSPAAVTALRFLVQLKSEGFMPPGAENMSPPEAIDAFATARTGIINNVWPANGLFVWPKSYPRLQYELIYPPVGPAGKRTTYFGAALLGMFRQSRSKDAAWRLIEYFTSRPVQTWLSETGFFPVSGELTPKMREHPAVPMYYEAMKFSIPEPRHPKTGAAMAIVNAEVQAVMTGRKTPEVAARDMQARILREALGR